MSTEKYHFCLLQYNSATKAVDTLATGNLRDKCCRPADAGQLVAVDPHGRLVVMHLFQGLLKVIPVESKKGSCPKLKDAFNLRIEELQVQSLALMQDTKEPTLAILHQTIGFKREVKSYVIEAEKRLSEGPFTVQVDATSHLLIAMPRPRGGLLIVAEECIQYYNDDHKLKAGVSMQRCSIVAHTPIDDDGYRHLLGDQKGNLMLLVLLTDALGTVSGLKLEYLGQTSMPSCLAYLDSGKVFVGSRLGPNQIIRMSSKRVADGTYLEVLDTEETYAPVLDFAVTDIDQTGQETLVTCSGAFHHGGLSVVRRGINAEVAAAFSLEDQIVTGIWALDMLGNGLTEHFAVSTAVSTELLGFDLASGTVEPRPSPIFSTDKPSLHVGQSGPVIFQVCSASINYGSCLKTTSRTVWAPQPGITILAADSRLQLLVVCLSNGLVVCFDTLETGLVQKRAVQLPSIASCVGLARSGHGPVALIGLWEPFSVISIDLCGEQGAIRTIMSLPLIPRSVRGAQIGGHMHVFAAMPNGTVLHGPYSPAGPIGSVKEAIVGQQQASLHPIDDGLFVLTDRPCVIKGTHGKPHFMSVPLPGISQWCPVRTAALPNAFIAVNGDNELLIGSLALEQQQNTRLHMSKLPMGETVRKIVHCKAMRVFAVITLKSGSTGFDSYDPSSDSSSVCLIDDKSFEMVSRYALPRMECAQSLICLPDDRIVVGTATTNPDSPTDDPEAGRLLTFKVIQVHAGARSEHRLSLINAHTVAGAVFSLAWIKDRLVASVNGQTSLYEWADGWNALSKHFGQVLGIAIDVLGDQLAIGDMLRSANVLRLSPEADRVTEVARDYYTGWSTAVKFLDKDHLLLADDHGNLSQLMMMPDPNFVAERLILDHVSGFHIGTVVNAIEQGSLSERTGTAQLFSKTFVFGTACGSLGTIGVIREAAVFEILQTLQANILAVSSRAGQISHTEWRTFYNEKRALDHTDHFIDGDIVQRFQTLPEELKHTVVHGGALGCKRLPQDCSLAQLADLVDQLSCQ